jgi:hypothetical protein
MCVCIHHLKTRHTSVSHYHYSRKKEQKEEERGYVVSGQSTHAVAAGIVGESIKYIQKDNPFTRRGAGGV